MPAVVRMAAVAAARVVVGRGLRALMMAVTAVMVVLAAQAVPVVTVLVVMAGLQLV